MKIHHTMGKGIFLWVTLLAALLPLPTFSAPPATSGLAGRPHGQMQPLPLAFERSDDEQQARFVARGAGFLAGMDGRKLHLALSAHPRGDHGKGSKAAGHRAKQAGLWMELVDASEQPQAQPTDLLPGVANYLIGDDPTAWRLGVRTYSGLIYRGVYPGIDLSFHGVDGQLEYDFLLQPGAAPANVRLKWHGSKKLTLDASGNLHIELNDGQIVWKKPFAYQDLNGLRREIPCQFQLTGGNGLGFALGTFDTSKPLVIDPVLIYSTYLGGSDLDAVGESNGAYPGAGALAVDRDGSAYITGRTLSTNFFRTNAFRNTSAGNNDLFVTKLNSNGTAVVFSTYLGGSGEDFGYGIAVDTNRNIYLTGSTDSSNFPRTNAFQNTLGAGAFPDAFLVKLNPGGTNLLYSSYLGGSATESGNAVAVDNSGNAYVAGETFSEANFPKTTTRFQSLQGGFQDAFVAKFNTAASGAASLVYASWLGGADDERANGIAVDSAGNAYVTGETYHYDPSTSSPFPVNNAIYSTYGGGISDGFIAKINSSGSAKTFSTFFGGAGDDYGWDIALDSSNNVYVVGETSSTNFPKTASAAQPNFASGFTDGYLLKLSSNGLSLMYSTYLGGTLEDSATAVAVDARGIAYVAGYTASINYPVTPDAYKTSSQGNQDAFLAVINPALSGPVSLVFSTYYGGPDYDYGLGVAVDSAGSPFIAGTTSSRTNFAVTAGAFQTNYGGGASDGFVARFGPPADLAITHFLSSASPINLGSNLTYTIIITNFTRTFFTNVTVTNRLPAGMTFVNAASSRGSCSQSGGIVTCSLGTITNNDAAILTINVTATAAGTATSVAAVNTSQAEREQLNNVATNITIVRGTANLALGMSVSPGTIFVGSNTVIMVRTTNTGPQTATGVLLTNLLPSGLDVVSVQTSQGSCNVAGSTVSCELASINNGTVATVTINARGANAGTWSVSGNVTTAEIDPNAANNSASVNVTVNGVADLRVAQAVNPNPVIVGSNVVSVVAVSNAGPSSASGVVLTNVATAGLNIASAVASQGSCTLGPNSVNCSLGTINSNGVVTVTLTYQAASVGSRTISSGVSSSTADPQAANNLATANVVVTLPADVRVAVSASPVTPYFTSNVVYTIGVTNAGPNTATSIGLQDVLPSGVAFVSVQTSQGSCNNVGQNVNCSLGTLASGAGAAITLTARVQTTQNITNTATASAAESDPNLADNTARLVLAVNPVANLWLAQTLSPTQVFVGSNLTCSILLSNTGPSTATAVTVNNLLSSGLSVISAQSSQGGCSIAGQGVTCNIGNLNSNASVAVTLVVRVTGEGTQSVYSDAQSQVYDPMLSNNAVLGYVTPVASADVRVATMGSHSVQSVNGQVTYTITVNNDGPTAANSVTLQDSLPAGVVFVSVETGQGSCTPVGQMVNCSFGNLPVGGSVNAIITVQGTNTATVTNTVQVSSGVPDPNLGNNASTFVTTFQALPSLKIQRFGTNVVLSWPTNQAGFSVQYRTNLGLGTFWSALPGSPQVFGGQNTITNRVNAPVNFFRLIK